MPNRLQKKLMMTSLMICFWMPFLIAKTRMKSVRMTLYSNQERIQMKTLYLMEILNQLKKVPSLSTQSETSWTHAPWEELSAKLTKESPLKVGVAKSLRPYDLHKTTASATPKPTVPPMILRRR